MREGYNSSDYWERLNYQNKTIREHMFMDDIPRKESIYIHTLSFSKKNGLRNVWAYFPSFSAVIGYIQYSFLQENFYKWIYGKDKKITKIPPLTVENIISNGVKDKKITTTEAQMMRDDLAAIDRLWRLPEKRAYKELRKFCREFNHKWYGSSQEFLYLKVFDTAEEIGEYILKSCKLTGNKDSIKGRIEYSESEWLDICKRAVTDVDAGEEFRTILLKSLTEIL